MSTVITANKKLVFETGLKNFAMPGLYSIVLKQKDGLKTRLFVYDYDEQSINKMIVPVHMHKYINKFNFLFGSISDYCYVINDDGFPVHSYTYSRLSDKEQNKLQKTNQTYYLSLDTVFNNCSHIIEDYHYHSVIIRQPETAWIIEEIDYNKNYNSNICFVLHEEQQESQIKTKQMAYSDFKRVETILTKHGFLLEIL